MLLTAPKGVVPYYLGAEVLAIVLVAVPSWPPVTSASWQWFGFLAFTGLTQSEVSLRVERIRARFASSPHINMTSVWIFAGALLVPPVLAAALTAVIYGHLWIRAWRTQWNRPAYRAVFSAATMVVSGLTVPPVLALLDVHAITTTSSGAGTLLGISVAGIAFTITNSVLVMIGLKLHYPERPFLSFVGTWSDNALELSTLCLGGVTALMLSASSVFSLLMLLPVVVLHRCVLMRELEDLVTKDQKTGLLTSTEWRNRATNELTRARQGEDVFGLLMIDLDHFRRINSRHGHLAGDAALKAVADTITAEVRTDDSVGRFGGEEFVVLLPGIREAHSVAVAERIRERVAELEVPAPTTDGSATVTGLSVSIGVATYPEAGVGVERLLVAADRALYRAKNFGRNKVVS
jgi:diguanylate cyclase (GGDEF)-like protein